MNLLDRINDLHDWTASERGKQACMRASWTAIATLFIYLIIRATIGLIDHYQSTL